MKNNSFSPFAIAFSAMLVAFVWSMAMHAANDSSSALPLPIVANVTAPATLN